MSEVHPAEILLVEDDDNDAEMTMRALRKARLTNPIRLLRDGAEALDFLFGDAPDVPDATLPCQQRPHIVLLDLKLPKVDGLEVLQRLKGDPRTCAIPVVVLTSSKAQRDLLESYKLGVNSYVVKPVSFDDFVEAIGRLGLYWMLLNQQPSGSSEDART